MSDMVGREEKEWKTEQCCQPKKKRAKAAAGYKCPFWKVQDCWGGGGGGGGSGVE